MGGVGRGLMTAAIESCKRQMPVRGWRSRMLDVAVQPADDTTHLAGVGLGNEPGFQLGFGLLVSLGNHPPTSQVQDVRHFGSGGVDGAFARSMSFRSQGMPLRSTFAHWEAVRRMERCSRRCSGVTGGRPRERFSGSMVRIVDYLLGHNK